MGMGKLGQAFTAKEIFDLVKADLRRVEEEIALESVSSVDAITNIGRYLQSSGGKRLRPTLLLLCSKMIGEGGPSAIRAIVLFRFFGHIKSKLGESEPEMKESQARSQIGRNERLVQNPKTRTGPGSFCALLRKGTC